MKNIFGLLIVVMVLMTAAWECSIGESKMTSFKTSKDKEGKQESTTFKGGETLYANAEISGSSKTTTKIWVTDDKNESVAGSEVKIELPRNGTAQYTLPLPASVPGGKYTLHADMLDDKGEKKDSMTVNFTIEGEAKAPPPVEDKPKSKKDKEDAGEEDDDG